eukprot:TRINITY_DN8359_c0_g1_i1.p1 TRINITY_DN8359_c0_g1~~TRINITY_DN8359_c0_g1_i1.p1  ORF type:complete len:136 (-),score=42.25 TRINITY_DN8359_c0_g1_i1:133-486(-)
MSAVPNKISSVNHDMTRDEGDDNSFCQTQAVVTASALTSALLAAGIIFNSIASKKWARYSRIQWRPKLIATMIIVPGFFFFNACSYFAQCSEIAMDERNKIINESGERLLKDTNRRI